VTVHRSAVSVVIVFAALVPTGASAVDGNDGIVTVAGTGERGFTGDGGPASQAKLDLPIGVAVAPDGDVAFADFQNNRVRRVDASSGRITTVAGGGPALADGAIATESALGSPDGVAFDKGGNLYITAVNFHMLFRVDAADGRIHRLAGGGASGGAGDGGPAAKAELNSPRGLSVDSEGNIYIADAGNHRIRRIDAGSGVITTVAGSEPGDSGDGGPATSAQLQGPLDVLAEADGSLLIADGTNRRLRRVRNGVITTVAGGGTNDKNDPMKPTEAALGYVSGIARDAAGAIYFVETSRARLRKIVGDTLTTVAGNGFFGNGGDGGPASGAQFRWPQRVAVASNQSLYIGDSETHRVRRIGPAPPPPPTAGAQSQKAAPGGSAGKGAAAGTDGSRKSSLAGQQPASSSPGVPPASAADETLSPATTVDAEQTAFAAAAARAAAGDRPKARPSSSGVPFALGATALGLLAAVTAPMLRMAMPTTVGRWPRWRPRR
jgi:sugar lactone lactonase YvrE